jgi:archaellum biogenesis ATPase FlaH
MKPLKPITRKLVMYVTGEDTFDDLLRFMVSHSHHVNVTKIKGSSAFREMRARAMYWAKKEDEKEFKAAMNRD